MEYMVVVMIENKRFKIDYDLTTGNYCLHDECKAKGVDGYVAYLSDEERANNLCNMLNEQEETINNLKKALWESEMSYIEEKNEYSIDVERDIDWLKKEFEREYWNGDVE